MSGWRGCPVWQVSPRSAANWLRPVSGRHSWFPHRYSTCSLERLPSSVDISATQLVLREGQLFNRLPSRCRPCRLVRVPNPTGIGPVNWFPHRYSTCSLVMLPSSEDGTSRHSTGSSESPSNCSRLVRLGTTPTESDPVNRLSRRGQTFNQTVRGPPNSGGMVPVSWRSLEDQTW